MPPASSDQAAGRRTRICPRHPLLLPIAGLRTAMACGPEGQADGPRRIGEQRRPCLREARAGEGSEGICSGDPWPSNKFIIPLRAACAATDLDLCARLDVRAFNLTAVGLRANPRLY